MLFLDATVDMMYGSLVFLSIHILIFRSQRRHPLGKAHCLSLCSGCTTTVSDLYFILLSIACCRSPTAATLLEKVQTPRTSCFLLLVSLSSNTT